MGRGEGKIRKLLCVKNQGISLQRGGAGEGGGCGEWKASAGRPSFIQGYGDSSLGRELAWHVRSPGFKLQHQIKPGMVEYACCPNTWEMEAGNQKVKIIFGYTGSLQSRYCLGD